MTARLSPQREAVLVEQIKQALSEAGAFCGECGFEPGERGCQDCETCWKRYADDLLPIVRNAVAAELAAVRAERDEAQRRVSELENPNPDSRPSTIRQCGRRGSRAVCLDCGWESDWFDLADSVGVQAAQIHHRCDTKAVAS